MLAIVSNPIDLKKIIWDKLDAGPTSMQNSCGIWQQIFTVSFAACYIKYTGFNHKECICDSYTSMIYIYSV